jgi:hypothetical protein
MWVIESVMGRLPRPPNLRIFIVGDPPDDIVPFASQQL